MLKVFFFFACQMIESSMNTREATRLRDLDIRHLGNARLSIDIDPQTGKTLGSNQYL